MMTVTIAVGTVFSKVLKTDFELDIHLWNVLRYNDEAKTSFRRDNGAISQEKSFYNSGVFLTGFLERVVSALPLIGRNVEIIDTRVFPDHGDLICEMNETTLRDYQEDAAKKTLAAKFGIARLATGAGKTEISIAITNTINQPTLFLVHRVNLMRQTYKRFCHRLPHLKDKMGMVGDSEKDMGAEICFATVQTIQSLLGSNPKGTREFLAKFRVLFVDEAHRASAQGHIDVITMCVKAQYRFGLTATPNLASKAKNDLIVEGLLGRIVANVPAAVLIERGYLAQPVFHFVNVNQPMLSPTLNNWHKIYVDGIVNNPHRNRIVIDNTKLLVTSGKRTLVIVLRVEHGTKLVEEMKSLGIKTVFVDGSTKSLSRQKAIDSLTTGENQVIVCTNVFDEGIDTKDIDAVILAAGTKSAPALFQRAGRAMRQKDEDNFCIIIDFIDHIHPSLYRHSIERYRLVKMEEGFKIV